MATQTITGTLNGESVSMEVDIKEGVSIVGIRAEQEWDLTTVDDSPATYITKHVGGRPDDRK